MRKLLAILTLPVLTVLLSVRLAFTEFFVRWEYSKKDFPEDRWGLSNEVRLRIAKLGLRAVLSDEGMKDFKRSGFFGEREIKHMEDVKELLSFLFPTLYVLGVLWLFLTLSLGSKRNIGQVLIISGGITQGLVLIIFLISLINYDWLFTTFHNYVFDPYSWRFKDDDMLLRVYPMKFWFDATLFVGSLSFILGSVLQGVGFLLIKIDRARGWA
ncbi:TIGR01906 family membrane protein [Hydrogenobacter hydrogenophilus]|uniref:Integral membrane protein TIGR01906 n=1 Tax=Hydrogenobacter hydrogenophilus TaxID=35835 RepID=A0A285P9D3_9AQUI|nr:TIGR01906 family membrane protein [Hydrogenobacter hydrogenophilus]SNZ16491.1 integral membrane protein TIGR01906 [Hydrogenobacter hydrogenophilus]